MAPPILSTSLIYITSANRVSGTPDDFTVSLPNSTLSNPWHGKTRITVVDCIVNRCFYSVREVNHEFSVTNLSTGVKTDYSIPIGNYTLQSWMVELDRLLPDFTVTHNATNGLCNFKPKTITSFRFTFKGRTASLFGFNQGDTPAGDNVVGLTSAFPLKLNIDSFINIHHSLPKLFNSSVANFRQKDFQENDVLIRLPVNVPSFANIVFQNTHDDYSFYLGNTHINYLRLWVTSEWNEQLDPFQYDWSITLRVDYEGPDDPDLKNIEMLGKLDEKLQYLALK